MSKVLATTLEDRVSGDQVPVDTVIAGSAKAWMNLNGTGTIAARGSFGVSSITDVTTGTYDVNFTTAFGAFDYAYSGFISPPTNVGILQTTVGSTASSARLNSINDNGSALSSADSAIITMTAHGDL